MKDNIFAEKIFAEQSGMKVVTCDSYKLKQDNRSSSRIGDLALAQGRHDARGVGVLVILDGQILMGLRVKDGVHGSPGGHVEDGETPKEAAARETLEEFGIKTEELIPIGTVEGLPSAHGRPMLYLCEKFSGKPVADGIEMENAKFYSPEEVLNCIQRGEAFEPFAKSIEMLMRELI